MESLENNVTETPRKKPTWPHGQIYALQAFGAQDYAMKTANFNGYSLLDSYGLNYNTIFTNIDINPITKQKQNSVNYCYKLNDLQKEGVDCVTDLYIEMSSKSFDNLKYIDLEIGGLIMDRYNCPQTQVRMNAELFKKEFEYNDDYVYFPLTMATFQDNNFLPLFLLKYHEAVIIFTFNENYVPENNIKFYGKLIAIGGDRQKIENTSENTSKYHDYTTLSTQYWHEIPSMIDSKNGINTYQLNGFYFNHPVSCIYFWGLDISKILSIVFKINSAIYLSTDVKTLRRYYGKTNNPDILVWMIKDNVSSLTEKVYSSLNFSRIDKFQVEIQTTEEIKSDIHYTAITHHIIRYINGRGGLAFSK
jgi:hypothetical protein